LLVRDWGVAIRKNGPEEESWEKSQIKKLQPIEKKEYRWGNSKRCYCDWSGVWERGKRRNTSKK